MDNEKSGGHPIQTTQAWLDYARQIVPRQLSCQELVKFFLVAKGECQEGE